jgi:hypothetical protein
MINFCRTNSGVTLSVTPFDVVRKHLNACAQMR